jgi:hypothetical protein
MRPRWLRRLLREVRQEALLSQWKLRLQRAGLRGALLSRRIAPMLSRHDAESQRTVHEERRYLLYVSAGRRSVSARIPAMLRGDDAEPARVVHQSE